MITLSLAERAFIQQHITDDVRALLLRAHPAGTGTSELDRQKLAAQIMARQKAQYKLPTWYANDALVFPPALSVEQASSEQTARYKASLINGKTLLDLTGGMGVDTWAFSQRVEQVIYVEKNEELARLATHNLPLLGAANVTVRAGDGLVLLDQISPSSERVDWIYLDPHRRDERGGKVVRFQDCEPDVSNTDTRTALLAKANHVLLKASPLLDIDLAIQQLTGSVKSVHIVAVQSEVKEILFMLDSQLTTKNNVKVNTVNLSSQGIVSFIFDWPDERVADVEFGEPLQYIYEPNAAVLKAGAFRLVSARFGLKKLAPNSHLYTSEDLQAGFPGRVFALQQVIKPDAKALKLAVPDLKANLTVRNFPQTVAELRKKLSLREGGSVYILATTLLNGEKRLLITQKVDQTHS